MRRDQQSRASTGGCGGTAGDTPGLVMGLKVEPAFLNPAFLNPGFLNPGFLDFMGLWSKVPLDKVIF